MNMQLMLGISISCYFISLLLICLYRDKINTKFFNALFIITDIIFYLCWNIATKHRGGLDDGFITFENISPYIFTIIPLTVFMSEKVRSYANSTIAFLCFGMFAALLIDPEYYVLSSLKSEADFWYTSSAVCHMLCSLYGMYLMITKQVKTDFSNWGKSIVFMWGSVTFGLVTNLFLDTTCFNMHPDHYRIYMLDIFRSFEATAAAYYLGILVVLTVGMQMGHLLCKLVDKLHGSDKHEAADEFPTPIIPSHDNMQHPEWGYPDSKKRKRK